MRLGGGGGRRGARVSMCPSFTPPLFAAAFVAAAGLVLSSPDRATTRQVRQASRRLSRPGRFAPRRARPLPAGAAPQRGCPGGRRRWAAAGQLRAGEARGLVCGSHRRSGHERSTQGVSAWRCRRALVCVPRPPSPPRPLRQLRARGVRLKLRGSRSGRLSGADWDPGLASPGAPRPVLPRGLHSCLFVPSVCGVGFW